MFIPDASVDYAQSKFAGQIQTWIEANPLDPDSLEPSNSVRGLEFDNAVELNEGMLCLHALLHKKYFEGDYFLDHEAMVETQRVIRHEVAHAKAIQYFGSSVKYAIGPSPDGTLGVHIPTNGLTLSPLQSASVYLHPAAPSVFDIENAQEDVGKPLETIVNLIKWHNWRNSKDRLPEPFMGED